MLRHCSRVAGLAALLTLCATAPTMAHVTANPRTAPAGSYFRTALRVGHGCEGSATVALRVTVPDGIYTIRPQMKPGWRITIRKSPLPAPVDIGHGHSISEKIDWIEWRGGPLPDAYFDEFGLSMKLPDTAAGTAAGTAIYFPAVQECEEGTRRWIEIPAGDGAHLKDPAPSVTLTPGHHTH